MRCAVRAPSLLVAASGLSEYNVTNAGRVHGVCVACRQAISDKEWWFRVRAEYVHLSCSERYLRLVAERRQQAKDSATARRAGHWGLTAQLDL